MYKLIWKNEIIDEADTLKEAQYLQGEYNMAYGGGVSIKSVIKTQDLLEQNYSNDL